jgi:hypothetical protein
MAQTNVQVFSGNVGIGVTAPDEALHVNGNIRIGGAAGVDDNSEKYIKTGTQLTIHGNDTDLDDSFVGTTVQAGVSNVASITLLGGKTNTLYQHIALSTKNTERMRIDRNGNVGIGTTSPQRLLHLKRSGAATFQRIQNANNNNGCGIELMRGDSDTWGATTWSDWRINNTEHLDFGVKFTGTDITSVLHLDVTGNVGIGLANNLNAPLTIFKLGGAADVAGGGITLARSIPAGFRGASIWSEYTSGLNRDVLAFGVSSNSDPYGGTPQMVLDSGGRLALGTTNPAQIVHVVSNSEIPLFEGDGGRSVYLRDNYALLNHGGYWSWDGFPGVIKTVGDGEFRIHGSPGSVSIRTDGSYLPFTGSHDTYHYYDDSDEGKLVYATGDYESDLKTGVYRNEIDIMQACPAVSLCANEKDKRVVGVLATRTLTREKKEITEKEYHELENEQKYAYSTNDSSNTYVAHIDTNEYSKGMYNALGEGGIWVSNKNGNFENGDYITSSTIPGYGQRQDDDILRNYTAAKITTDCDFTEVLDIKRKRLQIGYNYQYDENKQPLYENILDEEGNIITQPKFKLRYILPDGTEITKEQYTTAEEAYIAAFVGCTYHCG